VEHPADREEDQPFTALKPMLDQIGNLVTSLGMPERADWQWGKDTI
jgi:hypothetical protein